MAGRSFPLSRPPGSLAASQAGPERVALATTTIKVHAEDRFRVLGLHTKVKVPYITATNALLTQETTTLEPGVVDHKVYVRGIGTVKEEAVKGGNETAVLVSKTS